MQDDPGFDLVPVDHPAVDVGRLAAEVAAAAEAKRRAGFGASVPPEDAGEEPSRLRMGPRLSPLASTAEILPYAPLPARRPLSSAVKRAVRRGLRWYLWPAAARMSGHNRAVAEVVAEHERQLAWVRMESERVRAAAGEDGADSS